MIYGIGTDIVECGRVESVYKKHGSRFLETVLTPAETVLLEKRSGKAEFISGRWAAKEAIAKALGTGMGKECTFTEIEILPGERNVPQVRFLAGTAETVKRLGITNVRLSISHERHYAVAMALLEKAD